MPGRVNVQLVDYTGTFVKQKSVKAEQVNSVITEFLKDTDNLYSEPKEKKK